MVVQLVLFWLRRRRTLLLAFLGAFVATAVLYRLRRRQMGNCCASPAPPRSAADHAQTNGSGAADCAEPAQPEATSRKIASCGPEAEARARARPRRHRPQVQDQEQWPATLSDDEQAQGEAAGTLLRGTITINRNNPHQAYVAVPGRARDILIDSKSERNRALHGDTVLVELIDPTEAARTAEAENRRPRDRICGVVRAVVADPTRPVPWIPGVINVRGPAEIQFQPLDPRYPLVLLPRSRLDACPEARQQANQQVAAETSSGRYVAFKAAHSQWSDNLLLFESGRSFCRGKRRRDGGSWDMKWDPEGDGRGGLRRSGTLTLAWKGWDAEILQTVDGGQSFEAKPTETQSKLESKGQSHARYSFRLDLLLPGQEREGWLASTLRSFARDGTGANAAGELVLPKTLDANQRRQCHNLASKMNIKSKSRGQGADRQLVCWRSVPSQAGGDDKIDQAVVSASDSITGVDDGAATVDDDACVAPAWFDAAAAQDLTGTRHGSQPVTAAVDSKPKDHLYAVQLQLPWPRTQARPSAAVIRCLGPCDELAPHLEAVSMNHCVPAELVPLTPALEAECAVRDVLPESELRLRRDLRAEKVFSIDPAGAKDLDDALHIRKCDLTLEEDGTSGFCWEVGIHIADLSSFVEPGSALEQYAAARGTTTYLPTTNLPMVRSL